MHKVLNDPNKDQLSGLADLCFDLSKAAFVIILLPADSTSKGIYELIMSKLVTVFIALAFTYAALLLLRAKEDVKK